MAPLSGESVFNTSIDRAVALLRAIGANERVAGGTELARSAGIPKSTAFRLLRLMEEAGLVERQGGGYMLGSRLVELANRVSAAPRRRLRDIALPHMQDLYERTHGTIHLATLDGLEVLYLEKLYGHNPVKSPSAVGGRMPATSTALGKAMLAFSEPELVDEATRALRARTPYTIVAPATLVAQLHAVLSAGVAFDHEESALGLHCVSSPILDANGRPIAAISLSGPSFTSYATEWTNSVRRAAGEISRAALVSGIAEAPY